MGVGEYLACNYTRGLNFESKTPPVKYNLLSAKYFQPHNKEIDIAVTIE
jgi:hypothetical protein